MFAYRVAFLDCLFIFFFILWFLVGYSIFNHVAVLAALRCFPRSPMRAIMM
jgi:hypothetical protein